MPLSTGATTAPAWITETHAHDVSRTIGHNKQHRMIQEHAGLGRPVGTGRAEAQMHIVGSLIIAEEHVDCT